MNSTASRLFKNGLGNTTAVLVSAGATILSIPFLIDALGPVQWGKYSYFLLGLGIAGIIESLVFARLVAIDRSATDPQEKTQIDHVIRFFSIIMLLISIVIMTFTIFFNSKLSTELIIGFALGGLLLQTTVSKASLISSGKQIELSLISSAVVLIRVLAGVISVSHTNSYSSLILVYGLSIVLDIFAKNKLGGFKFLMVIEPFYSLAQRQLNVLGFLHRFRYSIRASLTSALASNLDRWIIGGVATVENFGFYTAIMSLCNGLNQVVGAIANAFIPLLKCSENDPAKISGRFTKLMGALILTGWMIFALYHEFLIGIFFSNYANSENAIIIVTLFLVGITFYPVWLFNNIRLGLKDMFNLLERQSRYLILVAITMAPIIFLYENLGAALSYTFGSVSGYYISKRQIKNNEM